MDITTKILQVKVLRQQQLAIAAEFDNQIEQLKTQKAARLAPLLAEEQQFLAEVREHCLANREALFGKRQSYTPPGVAAELQFRRSKPALEAADEKCTLLLLQEPVFPKVQQLLIAEQREMWLRCKLELNKEGLLRAWAQQQVAAAELDLYGLKVVQHESFNLT